MIIINMKKIRIDIENSDIIEMKKKRIRINDEKK